MIKPENKQENRFIDTNIWLYAFIESNEIQKTHIAKSIIQENEVTITSQVINETCFNLLRKTKFSEQEIKALITSFYQKYTVLEVNEEIMHKASKLRRRYNFSFWDSIIVSSALCSNCKILNSEDMQDGLNVENQLVIINPFK